MVKRSGAHTAKPNESTELVQFLVQRLRDYHDGNDLIPKKTAFEAGKRAMVWMGGSVRGVRSRSSASSSHGASGGAGAGAGGGGGGGGASSLSARPPPRSLPPLPPLAQGAVAEEPPPLSTARHLALSPIAPAAFGRGLRMREGE